MLENFTDEEIEHELLATGEIYPIDRMDERRIDRDALFVNGVASGHVVSYHYIRQGDGERRTERYRNLKELLFCECLTFDDLRKDWQYHGVLLGIPDFRARLTK